MVHGTHPREPAPGVLTERENINELECAISGSASSKQVSLGEPALAKGLREYEGNSRLAGSASNDPEAHESIYSVRGEIWFFIAVLALAQNLSTLSIPIYFPAIPVLSDYFETSVDRINLTATMYSIFQGVSPLLWGTISDFVGRRPIFMACIIIYIAANVGLAVAKSYWVLFGLRCLQAFGIASVVPLMGASVGDLTQRKNRGEIMGIGTGLGQLGNCWGATIGGGLISRWDWSAVFWFLACFAAFILALVFFMLPETHKGLAGDGSVMPLPWINRSPYAYLRHRYTGLPYLPHDAHYDEQWKLKLRRPNFLRWFQLLQEPDLLLILTPTSLHYATWFMILTIQSTSLRDNYGLTISQIGFTYLSSGVGSLIGSIFGGQVLKKSYNRHVRLLQEQSEREGLPYDPQNVNIYKARLGLTFWASAIQVATTLIFGWTIEYNVPIARDSASTAAQPPAATRQRQRFEHATAVPES